MTERAGSLPAAYLELTKPRLSFLSVLTALTGYFCSAPQTPVEGRVIFSLAVGTALAAGGCGAVNMWWERNNDAKMERTKNRPLPAGLIEPPQALIFGIILVLVGITLVSIGANPLAGILTAATAFSYLFLYTPLKSLTSWCTLVGSLPGAIPPIIGTAAKLGYIDEMGWLLFALLFCWQIPHFMALAMMWREDYERGGLKITTVEDPSGRTASIWAMVFIVPMMLVIALIIQTFFDPHTEETYHGLTSPFLWIASISTLWFFKLALEFTSAERRAQVAKPFFLASILYLPVVLLTLTLNRLF